MACDQRQVQRRSEIQPCVQRRRSTKSRPKIATAPAQRSIPFASEATWQERERRRWNGVKHVKATDAYRNMAAERSADPDAARDVPRTPDPLNRQTSKRVWEKSVQQWRSELQRWAEPVSFSPVSSS